MLLHKSVAWVDKKQFLTLSRYEKETESASDHLSLVCVCLFVLIKKKQNAETRTKEMNALRDYRKNAVRHDNY